MGQGIVFGTHLGFGKLPYRDGFFRAVLSQQALSHCPNRAKTFAEIFRVLQPGGVLSLQDVFCNALGEFRDALGEPGVALGELGTLWESSGTCSERAQGFSGIA